MTSPSTDIIEDLVERILEWTNSPQSRNFYRKAIVTMGRGLVEEEFGELKNQIRTGRVENPARYFTTLLNKRMGEMNLVISEWGEGDSSSSPKFAAQSRESYLSPTPLDLFDELKPRKIHDGESRQEKSMEYPYSKKAIPWATFLGTDFFTLSTNKARSDKVIAKFRTIHNDVITVPLVRGKFFPEDPQLRTFFFASLFPCCLSCVVLPSGEFNTEILP